MPYHFQINSKTVAYSGFFRLEVYRLQHELFAGGWSAELTRECLERGHAVAVLPYDPWRDEVLLIEQFRIGALNAPGGPWLLEIVAGIIEGAESPEQVAYREMQEEAGCTLQALVPIYTYLVSPGGTSERINLYCAKVDTSSVDTTIGRGLVHEHEDIRLHRVSRMTALDYVQDGRICSAAPIIALQWLALHHDQLVNRWAILQQ